MIKTPIFIFSLPRAGSTLLQRILSSDEMISTSDETWILLPFVYNLRDDGAYSEYSHRLASYAINDFLSTGDLDQQMYYSLIGEMLQKMYSLYSSDESLYFIDKTPRYYLILDEISRIFPNAKFIFLFRNPISVASSIIETWGKGRLDVYENWIDLFEGPRKLSRGYQALANRSIRVDYDDLVHNTDETIDRIRLYLGLGKKLSPSDFTSTMLEGSMGDPLRNNNNKISEESGLKYRKTFNSYFRKAILKCYLHRLGDKILSVHGYNKVALIKQVDDIKVSRCTIFLDLFDIIVSIIKSIMNYEMKRSIWRRLIKKRKANYTLS